MVFTGVCFGPKNVRSLSTQKNQQTRRGTRLFHVNMVRYSPIIRHSTGPDAMGKCLMLTFDVGISTFTPGPSPSSDDS